MLHLVFFVFKSKCSRKVIQPNSCVYFFFFINRKDFIIQVKKILKENLSHFEDIEILEEKHMYQKQSTQKSKLVSMETLFFVLNYIKMRDMVWLFVRQPSFRLQTNLCFYRSTKGLQQVEEIDVRLPEFLSP